MNSSSGHTLVENCTILDNGADGIKYVHHDEKPDEKLDRTENHDLCQLPGTTSQTFPIIIFMEQRSYKLNREICTKVFNSIFTIH